MRVRRLRWILWGLVVIAAAGFGFLMLRTPPVPPGASVIDVSELGGPFTLTDQNGRAVTQADIAGRPYAVFFGFTHCPDVCPTTLFGLTQLMAALGPDADRFKILFVSVDPERDTVEQLRLYMTSFDPRITALTGTPEATTQMLKNYRAYARKVPTEGGYTMDHTALVFLMGSDGRFVSTLDLHEPQEIQLGKLRRLVDR